MATAMAYDDEYFDTELDEIVEEGRDWMLPTSFAQQIFANATAVAGGAAGLALASRLTRAKNVSGSEVALAAGISAVVTFAAIFLIYEME